MLDDVYRDTVSFAEENGYGCSCDSARHSYSYQDLAGSRADIYVGTNAMHEPRGYEGFRLRLRGARLRAISVDCMVVRHITTEDRTTC